uniref:Putative odorant-binding protein n=1 Tax=Triatoma brasiliensis TaxID=65344 RepID=A0A162SJV8_TRIBS|nr:putative odorant-binding protein [Triatoma brasiliensis]
MNVIIDYENDRWFGQDHKRRQSGRGNGDSHSYGSNRREQNDENKYNSDPFNRHYNTSRGGTTSIGSPLEDIDACVIHCIFRQMKMVSDESYLNRNTVLNVLTRRIKDQELKAFIQEAINECFENLDPDDEEICDYSKSFAMCLEEKGKSNCDDWDLSAKFDRNNRSRNNNNNNQNGFSYQNSRG